MLERTRKTTALLLAFTLFAVYSTADLAHQHLAPSTVRTLVKDSGSCIQANLPQKNKAQPRCLSCFFAKEHHSVQILLAAVVILPQLAFLAPSPTTFLPQSKTVPCNDRAPPFKSSIS